MGCANSKNLRTQSPTLHHNVYSTSVRGPRSALSEPLSVSRTLSVQEAIGPLKKISEEPDKEVEVEVEVEEEIEEENRRKQDYNENVRDVKREASRKSNADYGIKFERMSEWELVAAGWPQWLAAVAGEAIEGWVPLRSDWFERLDKIGQGTYSNVYRALDLRTDKKVAVKKVRVDNFQEESVRFMAREILILRKLDHPNVMKLEGIITSRLSCTIYLVFEYMEHDLAGLISCPQVKFTDSQIKCLARQLLSGLEHCHSRGIMHRDIKCSNILVNNQGVLKIADFGLAYFTKPKNRQPLTSRVVTLWYRPPELLLGSTAYDQRIDLWSVGCVFAELFIGRPILKGRNEVEQLYKIFKLCGSPPDDYWKTSKLPLAAIFKPQQPYESTLQERCKEFPKSAVDLIETLLSVEPHKRGTASSALNSEYFNTKPYACDPSTLPKYPPNKEIDAKAREEAMRISLSIRPVSGSKNPRKVGRVLQGSSDFGKVIPGEEIDATNANRRSGFGSHPSSKQPYDTKSDISLASHTTQDSLPSVRSLPVKTAASTSFGWKKHKQQRDVHNQPTLRSHKSLATDAYATYDDQGIKDSSSGVEKSKASKLAKQRSQARIHRHESFDASDIYKPLDSSEVSYDYGNKKKGRQVTGLLLHQSQEINLSHYDQHRQALSRSRFHKE